MRPLLPTVFLPSAVFGIGQGAGSPVIALTARTWAPRWAWRG